MIELTLNGRKQKLDVPGDMPLLWAVRDHLGLTGSKFGCGAGYCGACTMHLDGKAIRSCITPISKAQGKSVTTIEGLSEVSDHPVQRAWVEQDVPQCGYCQSGQIMQAAALLAEHQNPSEQQIEKSMAGNLCRCGTYNRIKAAIKRAAQNNDQASVDVIDESAHGNAQTEAQS